MMGFEPMHIGTTIRGLNHLATPAITSRILLSAVSYYIINKAPVKILTGALEKFIITN